MGLIRRAFKRGDIRISRWIAENDTPDNDEVLYVGPASDSLSWDEAQQIVRLPNDAEVLAAAKAARIEADRQACRARLTQHYGDALEQVSRASGLYGATAQANHAAGVEACIAASNVARDIINAAATVAAVEAVIVAWPVLT